MKRAMSLFSLVGLGGAIVLAALLQTGCEEAKGLQGLKVDFSSPNVSKAGDTVEIIVIGTISETTTTQASGTFTNNTVTFTSSGISYTYESLSLPFVWQVEDSSVGTIREISTGYALYTAILADRPNAVIVRDQYDNKAEIPILPTSNDDATYSLSLTATKTSISIGEGTTITVSNTSAQQAPFSWKLLSGPGSVSKSSGASAGYSSASAGVAVIQATDANGASGVIAITVTEPGSDDGGGGGGGGGGPGGTDP